EDTITNDVNVTHGILEDTVPAGWNVKEGSYSVVPDEIVSHDDGSRTLRWNVDLRAALESSSEDPQYASAYEPLVRSYTLVAPALAAGRVELPRAQSDMDRDGMADAASAPPLVDIVSVGTPHPDAGGPYIGKEGDTILLSASGSADPDGDPLQFRWDFTGNGTFETAWSSSPTIEARYTDDFSCRTRHPDTGVHSAQRPPERATRWRQPRMDCGRPPRWPGAADVPQLQRPAPDHVDLDLVRPRLVLRAERNHLPREPSRCGERRSHGDVGVWRRDDR